MPTYDEDKLNKASLNYLGGLGRNFMRSMNPNNTEKLEKISPWREAKALATIGQSERISNQEVKTPDQVVKSAQATTPSADVITLQPYGMKRTSSNNTITPVRELAKSTISPGGFTVTPNESVYGGSIRSLGTPGTNGSGYGYTSGPARGAQSRESFLSEVARRNQMGRGQVDGYSFEGSGADFAKFAQRPTRPAQNGSNVSNEPMLYQQVRDRYESNSMDLPKYLGPESGLGWQTRLKKYEADIDAYNKATGNQTAMNIEAMREAGAGQRSLVQADTARQIAHQAHEIASIYGEIFS